MSSEIQTTSILEMARGAWKLDAMQKLYMYLYQNFADLIASNDLIIVS